MLKTFTLKNGLKVATYSIPEMRSLFLGLTVKSGWLFDTKKDNGIAHFLEHLLVQGTPSFPTVEDLSDFVEGLSGSYNASTSPETIDFHLSVPDAHLEDALKISSEVFFEPLFLDEAVDKERKAIIEELKQRQDTLAYKNSRFFAKTRFTGKHPFLLGPGGIVESVRNLQKKDLIQFWNRFFYPENTYLILVGDIKNSHAEQLITAYYGKYHSPKKFPGFPYLTKKDMSERSVAIRHDPQLRSCYITLSFPSISINDPLKDRVIQSVIGSILGQLRRSRLFRLLRQKRGLVYDVSFHSTSFPYFGYAYISFQVALESLEEVVRLITKELLVFVENGLTEEEVEFAKNYHINRSLMQFDHPSAIASWVEGDLLWEEKILLPEEYAKIIRSITSQDIMAFMKKYWDFSKLNLTLQGAVPDTKENVNKFSKLLEGL